eukprot:scaffold7496_cov38-Tisochrysis_lutea.AAC.2
MKVALVYIAIGVPENPSSLLHPGPKLALIRASVWVVQCTVAMAAPIEEFALILCAVRVLPGPTSCSTVRSPFTNVGAQGLTRARALALPLVADPLARIDDARGVVHDSVTVSSPLNEIALVDASILPHNPTSAPARATGVWEVRVKAWGRFAPARQRGAIYSTVPLDSPALRSVSSAQWTREPRAVPMASVFTSHAQIRAARRSTVSTRSSSPAESACAQPFTRIAT